MTSPYYVEIEHTADWALRIWGADMAELFGHAAEAMFLRMGAALDKASDRQRTVTLDDSVGFEVLLISWLNELLYLSEENEEIYSRFTIHELTAQYLHATVAGYAGRPAGIKIKAATFYDIHMNTGADRVVTTLTFDV